MADGSVADFYAGKSVFITGGTGFLGNVIIEKILYSCPQVENVYVLIREVNNNIERRMRDIFNSPAFERLKTKNAEQLRKLQPVAGDILLPGLGISKKDEEVLIDKVSIVIHAAANIKFNEPLPIAMNTNYEGTRKVLDLCKRMKNIKILIYVSTAYSHTKRKVIEEIIYAPPTTDIDGLYEKLHSNPEKENQLLFGWPNTYAFTKALAEDLVAKNCGDIPAVIVKPSIITASISEPVSGWVTSWSGGTGFLLMIAKGVCRVMMSRRQNIADVIPVDYVSNLIIVAAAKYHMTKGVKVLHSCTSSVNPITVKRITDLFNKYIRKIGANDIPFPKVFMFTQRWLALIVIFLTEMLPAFIADICLWTLRKPTRFVKIQKRVSNARNQFSYFTANSWIMKTDRTQELMAKLSPQDALTFPCNPARIDWQKYLAAYVDGVVKFLLNKNVK